MREPQFFETTPDFGYAAGPSAAEEEEILFMILRLFQAAAAICRLKHNFLPWDRRYLPTVLFVRPAGARSNG